MQVDDTVALASATYLNLVVMKIFRVAHGDRISAVHGDVAVRAAYGDGVVRAANGDRAVCIAHGMEFASRTAKGLSAPHKAMGLSAPQTVMGLSAPQTVMGSAHTMIRLPAPYTVMGLPTPHKATGSVPQTAIGFTILQNADKADAPDIGHSRRVDLGLRTQRKSGALIRRRGLSGAILFISCSGVSWRTQ
jgi:hypothetical protein